MLKLSSKISPIISSQLATYIRGAYDAFAGREQSKFSDFLEAYYEWMDQEGGVFQKALDFPNLMDIDDTLESFVDYFTNEFIPSIPRNVLADRRRLVKYSREMHKSKGTEKSFQLLFRILYNDEITISYPSYLLASGGDWKRNRTVRLIGNASNLSSLDGYTMQGANTGATIDIIDTLQFLSVGNTITEVSIDTSSYRGSFEIDEPVLFYDNNGYLQKNGVNIGAHITPIFSGVSLSNTIDHISTNLISDVGTTNLYTVEGYGGVNYNVDDVISIVSTGSGYDGRAKISKIHAGQVDFINIDAAGFDYQVGNQIVAIGDFFKLSEYNANFTVGETISGSVSNATAVVEKWESNSNTIWLSSVDGNFEEGGSPEYKYDQENIVGATSNAVGKVASIYNQGFGFSAYVDKIGTIGNIESVTITSNGEDYIKSPYLKIISATGSGASLEAFGFDIGSISEIEVDSDGFGSSYGFGWGYKDKPSVVFKRKIVPYPKIIDYFKYDQVDDVISTSNGAAFTFVEIQDADLTGDYTAANIDFGNVSLLALYNSNFTARAESDICVFADHPGYNDGNTGLLENEPIWGDKNHQFSYVIHAKNSIKEWGDIVKRVLHPAGMQMFGEIPISQYISSVLNIVRSDTFTRDVHYYWNKKIETFHDDTVNSFIQTTTNSSVVAMEADGQFNSAQIWMLAISDIKRTDVVGGYDYVGPASPNYNEEENQTYLFPDE